MSNLIEITVPTDQREGTESVIGRWLKKIGDSVKENEPLLEINTDKVTLEVAAPASGVLREIIKNPKEKVDLSEVLGRIEVGVVGTETKSDQRQKTQTKVERVELSSASEGNISPAVRKLLRENNIDPSKLHGTGQGGRITYQDVERFLENNGSTNGAGYASKRIAHSPMRKSIAHHMVQSMATAPHVTTIFEVDLSKALAHREKNKAEFESRGVKLTLTPYFIQATVKALQEVPQVNSRWWNDELEIIEDLNIGIAASTEGADGPGLVVPVIKKAQNLDLFAIAKILGEMTDKARSGKLTSSDLKVGTFTISNHGVSGSLIATPIIINQPQSAILGIGKLEKRVIVQEEDGKDVTKIKPLAYVTLTIDHRVLDGFLANRFLAKFVSVLESI